jgi:CDP-4-dehydro-6-deoxyglucose reductase
MTFQIQIEGGACFAADAGESVLEAAERNGIAMPHDCRMGGCGTCRIRLVSGSVQYEEEPFGLSPEEAEQGYALACQARPQGDLVIAPGRVDELPETLSTEATIREIRRVTDGIVHLVLETPEPVNYLAGQYLNIHLGDGEPRSFSMANAPGGTMLDFHVRRVPGGRFTEHQLDQAQPGQQLQVEVPVGSFYLRKEDYRPLLMVATGTGIAPIRAILESLLDDEDCPPVWLYWGMRTEADLWLAEEFASWKDRLYDFQFIPVLSHEGEDFAGRRGFVQDAIAEDFDDLSEHAIYLCGVPDMVRQAKDKFLSLNASAEHIYADSFSYAQPLEQKAA